MRLFLSSQDLGKYGQMAVKMSGKNKKAAFIKNAQDGKTPEERNFSTPEKEKMFKQAGFEAFEEIDLRDYFGKKDQLLNKLSNFGSVWCAGGNSFVLRRAMKASGLDEILKELLKKDKILYGGWSAGAMIMSPDLQGADWSKEDLPGLIPKGYDPNQEVIWEGLNLVPFYIVPHFGSELHGTSPRRLADYYKSKKMAHYVLSDGQVVIVDGDKTELLK